MLQAIISTSPTIRRWRRGKRWKRHAQEKTPDFNLYAIFMKVHCVTEKDALDALNIIDV